MITFASGNLVLHDRFRLVRELGEGGMGVVWEVEELATGKRRAIKFVKDEESSALATRRLYREAEAAAAISHPNIVRVLEVVEHDGAAAIVMELLEGESLGARLDRGPMTLGQTAAVLRPVISALRAAHAAGVIHRDLKPDNVFIVSKPDGTTGVCVLDFGVAKQVHLAADSLTVTGSIVGTPLYMSPEQAAGERGLDARTDVWSLAVLAFECLSGTTPVTGENYGQLLAQLIRGEFALLTKVQPSLPADVLACVDGSLVPRDRRANDFVAIDAVLSRYSDATIEPPPVGVSVGSASRSNSRAERAFDQTQLATSAGVTASHRPPPLVMLWGALGLVLGMLGGGAAYVHLRPTSARDASLEARTTATAEPSASPSVIAPARASAPEIVTPGPVPSASASTARVVSPPVDPKRKPVSSARPVASTTRPASSAAAGPDRLPGGVGGTVPF